MGNKFIFLTIVLLVLFGLVFLINQNRTARAKTVSKENARIARDQIRRDSLHTAQINSIQGKNQSPETSPTTHGISSSPASTPTNTRVYTENTSQERSENYSDYINPSVTNNPSNTNVTVTIVDENGNIASSISSSIAQIYTQSGNNGSSGLLRSSFTHKSGFEELIEGNSEIINNLKLSNYTDYAAIGKIRYSFRKGTLADGTIICNVSLSMSIISSIQKTITKSFSYSVIGNGVTETQAKEHAVQKLIDKYNSEYSSI